MSSIKITVSNFDAVAYGRNAKLLPDYKYITFGFTKKPVSAKTQENKAGGNTTTNMHKINGWWRERQQQKSKIERTYTVTLR